MQNRQNTSALRPLPDPVNPLPDLGVETRLVSVPLPSLPGYNAKAVRVASLIGIVLLASLLLPAIYKMVGEKFDDLRYGYPRTDQIDMYTGREAKGQAASHLWVTNMYRQVVIFECTGADANHCRLYSGPYLFDKDGDKTVVKLSQIDLNQDQYPDLRLLIGELAVDCLNDGTQFKIPTKLDYIPGDLGNILPTPTK